MSCQARKKKKDPFPLVPRGCRVSIRGSSPRAPGAHYREARGSGFPGNRRAPPVPTWRAAAAVLPPCTPAPRARRAPAPLTARCRLPRSRAASISIRDAPLPGLPPTPPPLPRPARSLEVAEGNELGTEEGGEARRARTPKSLLRDLGELSALSGPGRRKWKCEANQTRCDYF